MAEADSTTLGALIAPGSAAEFLRDYWPDKPFAAHGDAARLPPFLRAPELDSIETNRKAAVFGVSILDEASKKKFADKFDLNFPLLADARVLAGAFQSDSRS